MSLILQNVISNKFFCLDENGIAFDTIHKEWATVFNSDEEIHYMLNRFQEDSLDWNILTTDKDTLDYDLHGLDILRRADQNQLSHFKQIDSGNPEQWLEF